MPAGFIAGLDCFLRTGIRDSEALLEGSNCRVQPSYIEGC
jgi:hypothetical protein